MFEELSVKVKNLPRGDCGIADLTVFLPPASDDYANRPSKRMSSNPSNTLDNAGVPISICKSIEPIAPAGVTFDGTSSRPSSRRNTLSIPVFSIDPRIEDGYHDVEVPDHVDSRGAYGRRKTQDFGYPGARTKVQGISRVNKRLQDPESWLRRSCGHFSYTGKGEVGEDAAKKICRQCSARATASESELRKRHQIRRRIASDSLKSGSSATSKTEHGSGPDFGRRRRHSECIPTDKCGDVFADDLAHIIDAILEEHTTTLQGVIDNIKHTQPGLSQLRRLSEDIAQRYQVGDTCTHPRHTTHPNPRSHETTSRPVCQPHQPVHQHSYQPQVYECTPPSPYIPPKAAEKLNVGPTGHLGPNMNDSRFSLREAVRTIPDLIGLVNSAADDLGVDLDRRPTAKDDVRFLNAPVEDTPSHAGFFLLEQGFGDCGVGDR
ncbi:hypothetical protein P153DRAFT_180501 [Dothidotthia symphoricarpi CBS 119687]|uniref:Uncharacterized protein n=1 Tax=Dothidotthia symphoricarpi CBS 119687 TaxID=1392245 RepID=A0A6A6AJ96_9PLEO|nr:uncharacterized protein P153DRAFT_180501 [Dothidotthia symphoricarpi CBS 119687]KAF2131880.1 hypothetical protein P153DRAFT_180501 [Dothidotthia symphoricarpi CBS 119687]